MRVIKLHENGSLMYLNIDHIISICAAKEIVNDDQVRATIVMRNGDVHTVDESVETVVSKLSQQNMNYCPHIL